MAGVSAEVAPAVGPPVVAQLAASPGAHRVLDPDEVRKAGRVLAQPASLENRVLVSPVVSPVVRVLAGGPALLVQAVGLMAVREHPVPSGRRGR